MYLTGLGDEAGASIDIQIRATKELGWKDIEVRAVEVPGFPAGNIHDIPDKAFEILVEKVNAAGVRVSGFASAIGNWGKRIDEPGESSLAEARRAIPRMQRLGTTMVRIMSFAVREGEDQMEEERFRRLREITKLFLDAGIRPVHENCMNYGGMGWQFTLKMLENVPGLKLVFDTGNPVFLADRSQPPPAGAWIPNPAGGMKMVTAAGSAESVLTIRAKKSDIDAYAKGKSNLDDFRKRATVLIY